MLVTTNAYAFGTRAISTGVIPLVSVTGLDAGQIAQVDRARITVATDAIRYRYDGGDPSATVGHYLPINGETVVEGQENIARLRFIRAGSGDATLSVTLEKF